MGVGRFNLGRRITPPSRNEAPLKATTFQASLNPGPAIAPGDPPFLHSVLPAPGPDILVTLGKQSFSWDIAGDTLHWSDNVQSVLRDIPQSSLSKASEFSKLIEPMRAIRQRRGIELNGR